MRLLPTLVVMFYILLLKCCRSLTSIVLHDLASDLHVDGRHCFLLPLSHVKAIADATRTDWNVVFTRHAMAQRDSGSSWH